jgi:hypothetical protein
LYEKIELDSRVCEIQNIIERSKDTLRVADSYIHAIIDYGSGTHFKVAHLKAHNFILIQIITFFFFFLHPGERPGEF